ncbi:hypothetical protein C8A05DRAFT_12302 [Staphylotrichum tortipilum]|uniref:Methyltransferase type 11 domain-containing protein n=1 Tax=Staphylotrichum tortipilum TaxID=2831512 RepID=A0AAN6MUL5_9PEZI|nr:hypothetical protein C8A05DRAFT_12302 [Staphylotrichum longicolle]
MASSRRPGPHAFGWPGAAGPRDVRAPTEYPVEEDRLNAGWKARRPAETHRQPSRTIPQPQQPGLSSRLPQALSQRRPSDSQLEQPRFTPQHSRMRSSIGSASHLMAAGDAHGASSSSAAAAASRLPGPGLKPRNILRRKRSGLSQDTTRVSHESRNDSTGTTSSDFYPRCQTPLDPLHLDRELTQSPMEIRVAQKVEIPMTKAQAVTIYPELDRYRDIAPPPRSESPGSILPYRLATHDLPPPTPLFSGTSSQVSAFSGSPSTRWSGSPGPGPYSRDTTPTSISSQSPGLVAPIRIPPPGIRAWQADPALTRPPVTRRRAGSISNEAKPATVDPDGLSVVRELSTSSSSNSTVRSGLGPGEKKKSKGSPQRPPNPPPRKSSQRPNNNQNDLTGSPYKGPRKTALPQATAPPSVKPTSYSRPRPAQTAPSLKPTPPVRPSRDGTADLHAPQLIPVIHSNLSSTSLTERRQSALLAPNPASRPAAATTTAPEPPTHTSRRAPVREPTPTSKPSASGGVTGTSKQEPARPARTPSPSVSSTYKMRFPLFGRRTKTVPEPGQAEKKDKPTRKGPAAGTGHEGYGKLGSARRRSNSLTSASRVIPGTMSSQESLSSQPRDPFLMARTAPVIIAGGEVVENRNTSSELTRTDSNQSAAFRRPSVESHNSSQVSLSSREGSRKMLWPSPFPRSATQSPSLSSRRPSESSDSEAVNMKPTLAFRRSMQRLKAGEHETPRLPKPIVTRPQVVSPAMTSLDASIMSDDSIFDPSAEPAVATREPTRPATSAGPKKLTRRARSPRRWNFFGRSHSQAPAEKKAEPTEAVAATVQVVQNKPIAFYTMIDSSEQGDSEPADIEELMREARGIAITTPDIPQLSDAESPRRPSVTRQAPPTPDRRIQQAEDQHLPHPKRAFTAPINPPASSPPRPVRPELAPAQQSAQQPPARPSRLPQVGRIPKVVSARAEQISPKSFSRPFHRLSVQMAPVKLEAEDEEFVAKGPSPPKPSTPEPTYEDVAPVNDSNFSALIYGIPRLSPPTVNQAGREFLSFSPRKDSTTSSNSSGGLLSFADATAIVPSPSAPLAEDEIWDEYNDLLGEDTIRLSTFQGPSWPKPLRLEGSNNTAWTEPALESPTLSPPPLPSLVQALRQGMEHPSLSLRGSDIAEEVKRMLECDPTPENSVSVTNSFCSQDDRADIAKQMEEKPASTKRNSDASALEVRRSNASSTTQCSEDSSPLSQVNLRVGSMTVSKWLTFGHVLFSPVRDELVSDVGSLKRPSILVVDGLGNDDWSFYAAETYPAATFFNLSPRAPLPTEHRNESSFPLSPPNHHQVQYLSHTAKFPFGAQSFTAVVFRFPVAAPEAHYRNIISEARRVLKPGGYIELSILDADLNNMGNRCRRSVRRLKERIHTRAPDTSLGSTSDLILRLIGRRGFLDVKTCRVGVPIASTIARSSGSSEAGSSGKRFSTGGGGHSDKKTRSKAAAPRDERSLPEMINDEGPVADESIAKSVAKVGRWWYNQCYEGGAASGPRGSIWRDRALLGECEEWGTSLKLMVCHARVPDGRARVASI